MMTNKLLDKFYLKPLIEDFNESGVPGLGIPERTRVLKSKGATLIFIRGDFAVNGTSTSYAGKSAPVEFVTCHL
jgi:hypothetical protein